MKQILHFLNEYDFQNFTSQLFGEELPSFQPIEGAGGDGGLDGIETETAYQMYFPEQKNRTKQKYLAKIDDSLTKLQATIASKNLSIKRWIFVVPEDLQYEVVLHLQKKSQDTGIECLYWGATKLTALVNKYPYIRNAFPGAFLPDLKEDVERVNDGISELSQKVSNGSQDIIKEDDYVAEVQRLKTELNNKVHSAGIQLANSSAAQQATHALNQQYQPKFAELRRRKDASDRLYELEVQEVNKKFDKQLTDKDAELVERGMFHSGARVLGQSEIESNRKTELERLAIRFGKPAS